MRGELPSFKRCCFCCSLRRGLLFWGYFKLMFATLLLYPMGLTFMFFLHLIFFGLLGVFINLILFITLVLDFAFNIALVIAGHTKNHKIFRVYYYYTITSTILSIVSTVVLSILVILKMQFYGMDTNVIHPYFSPIIWGCIFTFAYLVLQIYIILLVRSEVLKLKTDGQFHFVNNEAEAECTLNMNLAADHEKMKELNTEKEINYVIVQS